MIPSHQLLPGLDAGYRSTYKTGEGVLRPRTQWITIDSVDHQTGVVNGTCKVTGEPAVISLELIHTVSSPFEHL